MGEKSNWEDEGGANAGFQRWFDAEWGRNEAWIGFDGEKCGWSEEKIGRLEGIKGKN